MSGMTCRSDCCLIRAEPNGVFCPGHALEVEVYGVAGGQGRLGADCLWHAGVLLWVALNLAALLIVQTSFPSGEPPSAQPYGGGSLFRDPTVSAPHVNPDAQHGAGAAP